MDSDTPISIAVFGLGHVGLTTALGFSDLGWNVIGVESDMAKMKLIQDGQVPFNEYGISDLLAKNLHSGRFSVTADIKEAVCNANILIMCVGTPQDTDGTADISQLESLAREIAQNITSHKIVVQKSTAPVNTAAKLKEILLSNIQNSKGSNDELVDIVVIPEFLREGNALHDFFNPHRIVIGLDNFDLKDMLGCIYKPLLVKMGKNESEILIYTDISSAEISKHTANAFLATKISFVNMIADLCTKVGADVEDVARSIGMDPRIGSDFLKPGIGFGGSCLPKDLAAFIQVGKINSIDFSFLEEVNKINELRISNYINQLINVLGDLKEKTLAVWGLSFKPGTDDIRDSAAIRIVSELIKLKANLRVHDPYAITAFKEFIGVSDRIYYAESPSDATVGVNAILILTDWVQYKEEDFKVIRNYVNDPLIFDGRNLFDPDLLTNEGFQYYGIGR